MGCQLRPGHDKAQSLVVFRASLCLDLCPLPDLKECILSTVLFCLQGWRLSPWVLCLSVTPPVFLTLYFEMESH